MKLNMAVIFKKNGENQDHEEVVIQQATDNGDSISENGGEINK